MWQAPNLDPRRRVAEQEWPPELLRDPLSEEGPDGSIYATVLLVTMHQMKVCIVGAPGKFGQYLVQHALDRDCEVVAAPATSRLPFP